MAITAASLAAKQRILSACVRLFLEKGYKRTTVAEILKAANVSASTFQNIFHTKDGVFIELVRFMFDNQFNIALKYTEQNFPPVFIYALETSIQLTLTELNENLRELYTEAYTQKEASEYIRRAMARELYDIFGLYQPTLSEEDFYALEIGSAGMMRAFMAAPCDASLTLEKKLRAFLAMSLRAYKVPEPERYEALVFVEGLDIRTISEQVMQKLFHELEMHFDFTLDADTQAAP